MNRTFAALAVLILFFKAAQSQTYSYLNYTQRNGLPSSNIYTLYQDKDGFIWAGTDNGFVRFDGSDFKLFSDNNSIAESETFAIFQDSRNRLWMYNYSNCLCYYLNGELFSCETDSTLKGDFSFFIIKKIFEDKDGVIWFTGHGLVSYSSKSGLKSYKLDSEDVINDVLYDEKGKLTFISSKGIYKIENDSVKPQYLSGIAPGYMNVFRNGTQLYIVNNNKVIVKNFQEQIFKPETTFEFDYAINRIKFINDSKYFCTAGKGCIRVNTITGDTTVFLDGITVTDVIKDREGNLWFSTFGSGVYMLSNPPVTLYKKSTGISSNAVYSVFRDDKGVLWLGFGNGQINRIDKDGIAEITLGNESGYNRVLNIEQSGDSLYFATDAGIYVMNRLNHNLILYERTASAKQVFFTGNRDLYFAGSKYGGMRAASATAFNIYLMNRITTVAANNKGLSAWGTVEGVHFFRNGQYLALDSIKQLKGYRIIYLKFQEDSVLWISIAGRGVVRYNIITHTSTLFDRKNGLLSNNIKHIFIDSKNTAWLSGFNGISKIDYNGSNYSISNYTSNDGLPTDEINQVYAFNDTLYVATLNGFAILNTLRRKLYNPPTLMITSCITPLQHIYNPHYIKLRYWENKLTVNINGISFSAGGNLRYKYKLIGIDDGWSYTNGNEINYASLSPGKYTLMVFAIHPKGLMSERPAILNIEIDQPYWKTPLFIVSMIALIVVVILLLYRFVLRRSHRKVEMQNQLLTSEIKALRSQMNPHFIFNSLNSLQDFIFSSKKEEANYFLSEFSRLIRMILENSQQHLIRLDDETHFLETYLKLEKLRLSEKLSYQIEINVSTELDRIMIPNMIIQPFVENAILHGISPKKGGGTLMVKFTEEESRMSCQITDSGIGYFNSVQKKSNNGQAKKNDRKSLGIKNVNDRVEALNRIFNFNIQYKITTLADREGVSEGTAVFITFSKILNY